MLEDTIFDARAELKRRRNILERYIGQPVAIKRQHLTTGIRKHGTPVTGVLVDVKRTRAVIQFGEPTTKRPAWLNAVMQPPPRPRDVFGETGEWLVPIGQILLPGSIEADPRQLPLISDAAEMAVAQ